MHPSAPAFAHNSVVSSECAIQFGVHGPVLVISSACTSSTDAIGLGAQMIESGMLDVALVGGAEAPLVAPLFASFDRLGMMPRSYNECPRSAARPFDVHREGLVLGEGAVAFVLEDEALALSRGASPLLSFGGYAATCDAASHFSQEASGADAVRAISTALAVAGVEASEVNCISAHGTGTRENDPFESFVLRSALGSALAGMPVAASKSQCGHLLGASGAIGVALVLGGVLGGFVPPVLNLEAPDPNCELSLVRGGRRDWIIEKALCTSFGFGARNAALVVERYRVDRC